MKAKFIKGFGLTAVLVWLSGEKGIEKKLKNKFGG